MLFDEPPSFPVREADFAAWWAYSDRVMPADPRLGTLIARELALPATPDRAQLDAFHAAARPRCASRQTYVGWCLGHARSLTLFGRNRTLLPSHGALANAHDFLRRPVGSRLESFSSAYRIGADRGHWRRLWSALPATCTHVTLHLDVPSNAAITDELLGRLPASVRTLALRAHSWSGRPLAKALPGFVNDRFDVIDIRGISGYPIQHELEDRITAALSATRTVSLRVARQLTRIPLDRRQLAPPRAAAMLASLHPHLVVLERRPLLDQQRRYGVIPIRSQIAEQLPEWYVLPNLFPSAATEYAAGDPLVRRGERWTLRSDGPIERNGHPIEPGTIVELAHGDTLTLRSRATRDEATYQLICRDVDAICREWLARTRAARSC
jgi:hypothetical protein